MKCYGVILCMSHFSVWWLILQGFIKCIFHCISKSQTMFEENKGNSNKVMTFCFLDIYIPACKSLKYRVNVMVFIERSCEHSSMDNQLAGPHNMSCYVNVL
jgi:hypothetical protein